MDSDNIEYIKTKFIEKLCVSKWDVKLRSFIQSSDFEQVINKLEDETKAGKRFTPALKYVFSAFENCPIDKLKVVIIGQDPYPQINVADGIAFSCSRVDKPQPSLVKILESIEDTQIKDNDLKPWANQGVLLLNSAFTCEIGKPGTHYDIWHPFMMYILDMICYTNSGIIFILLGKKAQELESYITPAHYILKASHPASAAYTKQNWDNNDVFNKANSIIEKNNGSDYKIKW
jgi:uracil-DNA glycosylase